MNGGEWVRRALRLSGPARVVAMGMAFLLAAGGYAGSIDAHPAVNRFEFAEAHPVLNRFEFAEPHMGTTIRLVLFAPDQATAAQWAERSFGTFQRLDSLFSDYRADSEISALAATAGSGSAMPVSPELMAVLSLAQEWNTRTEGAFDVTVGSMTQLWRWAIRRGELPDVDRLNGARDRVDASALRLDLETGTASLALSSMSLDLGGIAKGYAAQRVLDELHEGGIVHAMVDAGGDLVLGAAPPGEPGWRVKFPDGQTHYLADIAVATSGDRYQYLEIGGVRYSHILDPETGLGIRDAPTVVVVAPDGATADVLASALTVLAADPSAVDRVVGDDTSISVQILPRAQGGSSMESPGFPRPRADRPDRVRPGLHATSFERSNQEPNGRLDFTPMEN